MAKSNPDPVVVGISGATGVIYGIEILKALQEMGQPSHLIISEAGIQTLHIETDYSLDDVRALATVSHNIKDIGAAISSGSFRTRGMVVAPCSVKTLSGIANSFDHNLLIRAADVTLKERRPLLLLVRETPLHKGHLELMMRAADYGATIMPPLPAFYHRPQSIDDIVRHTVGRALDHLAIDHQLVERWQGTGD
ncbi:MAG TPA: UbiX family flavin prenyltransferase [Rhodospirillales bacterium]|nr:UbiX family flavin prenyltransferase [Rhodospirillales bacterium]